MFSNIERAVSSLLSFSPSEPFVVSTVFKAYIAIAGFENYIGNLSLINSTTNQVHFPTAMQEAVLAFERALDKYPESGDTYAKVIEEIRRQYWYEVLGGKMQGGDGKVIFCPCCGKMKLLEEGDMLKEGDRVEDEKALLKRKRTRGRRTKTKARDLVVHKAAVFDPYGPSTSTSSI